MQLEPIGRVDDPSALDLEPIEVPVVGYTLDKEEVCETFKFRPTQPAGATLDILKATGANGAVPTGLVMTFLDQCLLESDREAWEAFLRRPDVMIEQGTLAKIYQAITEVYAARPTLPSSGSGGGGSGPGKTSRAVPRSRASASKKKTSP